MDFWNTFKKLCDENNIKPTPLLKKLNIAVGLVTKWKKGTVPEKENLLKLSEYFDVSVDYLLGKEEKTTNEGKLIHSTKEVITDSEHAILKKYNKLNDIGKNKADSYIDGLLENPSYCKDNVKFAAEMPVSVPPKVVKKKRHT